MTTNVYLGFPFGAISILLHLFLLFFDPRPSYRFYNVSLLIWVCGNYLWMSIEFCSTNPSSHVHVGPSVPLGCMSDTTQATVVNTKTILFLISSTIQLVMYILIFGNCIRIPEEEDEDIISKNEAWLFCYGKRSYSMPQPLHSTAMNTMDFHQHQHQQQGLIRQGSNSSGQKVAKHEFLSLDDFDDMEIDFTDSPLASTSTPIHNTVTLAFIENAYIIFWISKDLFWSWGTGDLTKGKNLAIMFEALAMCFGLLSIFIYILTAYLYRRNVLRLLDSITTIFWISANYVWMCGEFFLRYENLTYDDEDEGNDTTTRIVSAILFCLGIILQIFVCSILVYQKRKNVVLLPTGKGRFSRSTAIIWTSLGNGMLGGPGGSDGGSVKGRSRKGSNSSQLSSGSSDGEALDSNKASGNSIEMVKIPVKEYVVFSPHHIRKNDEQDSDDEEIVVF
jgi:hypothetical protein